MLKYLNQPLCYVTYKRNVLSVSRFCFTRIETICILRYFQNYKEEQNGLGFFLDEEVDPEGHTHGGYGYLDQTGDLVYVEYEKNLHGKV